MFISKIFEKLNSFYSGDKEQEAQKDKKGDDGKQDEKIYNGAYKSANQIASALAGSNAPQKEKKDIKKTVKALRAEADDVDERIGSGSFEFKNPILEKYYRELNKNETKLAKNKKIDTSNLMSERFVFDHDIGAKDDRPEGYSGLYREGQLEKAGMPLGSKKLKEFGEMSVSDVPSTAIARVRYNPKTENLYVTFTGGDGKEYLFPRVPADQVRQFINASSKGRHYLRRIKPMYAVSAAEAKAIAKKYKGE